MSDPRLTHGGRCLELAGKVYLLAQRSKEVWLTTPDGTLYVVTAYSCDCKSWQFRCVRTGGKCKHQRACFALGLLADPDEALSLNMGGVANENGGAYDSGHGEEGEPLGGEAEGIAPEQKTLASRGCRLP